MSYPITPPTKDDLGPIETCYTMAYFADKSIPAHVKLQKALKAGLALPGWLVEEARKQYRESRLNFPGHRYHVTRYYYDPRMIPVPGHPEWEFNPSYPREYPRLIKKQMRVLHDGTVRKEKRSQRRYRLEKFWEKKAKRGTHFSKLLTKKKEMRRNRCQKKKKKLRTSDSPSSFRRDDNAIVNNVSNEYSQDEDVQLVFDIGSHVYPTIGLQLPTFNDFFDANSHDPKVKSNGFLNEFIKLWWEKGSELIPEAVHKVMSVEEWFYLPKIDERIDDPYLLKRHLYRKAKLQKRHDEWEQEEMKRKDSGSRIRRNISREEIMQWARDCEEWHEGMNRAVLCFLRNRASMVAECFYHTEMVEANWKEFIARAWERHQLNNVNPHDTEIFKANGQSLLPIVDKMNKTFHFRDELRQCKECIDDIIQLVSCQEIIPQLVTVKEVAREQLWDRPTTVAELEYLHPENEEYLMEELKKINAIRDWKACISKSWNMFALLKGNDWYWTVPLKGFVNMYKSETAVPEGVLRKFKPDFRCPIEVFKVFLTTNMDTEGRTKTGSDVFEYHTLPEIKELYHEELARRERMLKNSRGRTYYSGVLQKTVNNPYRSFHIKKKIDKYVLKQNLKKFVKPSVGYSWRTKPFSMFNLPLTRKEEKTRQVERRTRMEDIEATRRSRDMEQSRKELLQEREGPPKLSDILNFPVKKYPMIKIPYEKEKKPSVAQTKYVLYMLDRLDNMGFTSAVEKQKERERLIDMADPKKLEELIDARSEKCRMEERLTRIGPLEKKERALGLKDDPGASTSNYESSRLLTHFYSTAGMEKPRDPEWDLLMEYEKEKKEMKKNEKKEARKQDHTAKKIELKKKKETFVKKETEKVGQNDVREVEQVVPDPLKNQDIMKARSGKYDILEVDDEERQMLENGFVILEDYFEKQRSRASVTSDFDKQSTVAESNSSEEHQEDTTVAIKTPVQNGTNSEAFDYEAWEAELLAKLDAMPKDVPPDDSDCSDDEKENTPDSETLLGEFAPIRQQHKIEQKTIAEKVVLVPNNDEDAVDYIDEVPEHSEQQESPEPRHDEHETAAGGGIPDRAVQQEPTTAARQIEVVTLDDDDEDDDDCVVIQETLVKKEVKQEVEEEEAEIREERERQERERQKRREHEERKERRRIERVRQEQQERLEKERERIEKEQQEREERQRIKRARREQRAIERAARREARLIAKIEREEEEKMARWRPFVCSRDDPDYYAKYKIYKEEMFPDTGPRNDDDILSSDEPPSSDEEDHSNWEENVEREQLDPNVQTFREERRSEDSLSRSVDIPISFPIESRNSPQPMPEQFFTNEDDDGQNTPGASPEPSLRSSVIQLGDLSDEQCISPDLEKVKEEPVTPINVSPEPVDLNEAIEEREQTKSMTPEPVVKAEPVSPARSPSLLLSEVRTEDLSANRHYSPTTFEQVSATIIMKRTTAMNRSPSTESDESFEQSGFSDPVTPTVQVTENVECELREVKQEVESPVESPVSNAAQLLEPEVESDDDHLANNINTRFGSSEPEILSDDDEPAEENVHPYVLEIKAGLWDNYSPPPIPDIYGPSDDEEEEPAAIPETEISDDSDMEEPVASHLGSVKQEDAYEQEHQVIKDEPASPSVSPIPKANQSDENEEREFADMPTHRSYTVNSYSTLEPINRDNHQKSKTPAALSARIHKRKQPKGTGKHRPEGIHNVWSDDSFDEDELLGDKEDVPETYDEDYLLSNDQEPASKIAEVIEGEDQKAAADALRIAKFLVPFVPTFDMCSEVIWMSRQAELMDSDDEEALAAQEKRDFIDARFLAFSPPPPAESVTIVEPTPENDCSIAVENIKEERVSPDGTVLAPEDHEPSVEIIPAPEVSEEVHTYPEIPQGTSASKDNKICEEPERGGASEVLVVSEKITFEDQEVSAAPKEQVTVGVSTSPEVSETAEASEVTEPLQDIDAISSPALENIKEEPISPDVSILAPKEPSFKAIAASDVSLESQVSDALEATEEVLDALLENGEDVVVTYDEDYLLSEDHERPAVSDDLEVVKNLDVQPEAPSASDAPELNDALQAPVASEECPVSADLVSQEPIKEPVIFATPEDVASAIIVEAAEVSTTSKVSSEQESHVASELDNRNVEKPAPSEVSAAQEASAPPSVPLEPEVPAALVASTTSRRRKQAVVKKRNADAINRALDREWRGYSIEPTSQAFRTEPAASVVPNSVSAPNEEPITAPMPPDEPVQEVSAEQKPSEPEPEPEVLRTPVKEPPAKKTKNAVSDDEESEPTFTKRVLRSAVKQTPIKKNKGGRPKKSLNTPKARIQPKRGAKHEDAADETVQDAEPEVEEEKEIDEEHVEEASVDQIEDSIPIQEDFVHEVHNEEDLLAEPIANADDQLHNAEPEPQFTVEELLGEDVPVEEPLPEPVVEEHVEQEPEVVEQVVVTRKRGRPKKVVRGPRKNVTVKEPEEEQVPETEETLEEEVPEAPTKRTLRKRGIDATLSSTETVVAQGAKKKKGMVTAKEPEEEQALKEAAPEEEDPRSPSKRVLRGRGVAATLPSTTDVNAKGAKSKKRAVAAEEREEEQDQVPEEAANEEATKVPPKRVLRQRGLETTLLSTEVESATRRKRNYLSKNNPAPRVRAAELEDEVVRQPVRLTGVAGAYSESPESSPERDLIPMLQLPEEPAQEENPQPVIEQREREIKSEEPDENWVTPPPVNDHSRKSKKRLRQEALEKDVKQEDGVVPADPDCEVLMSTMRRIKQENDEEMEDCMIVQANYKCSVHVAVDVEPEIDLPKIVEHPGEGIRHLHRVLKKTWDGINQFFMSDPAKFSKFSLILAKDSDKKGRVFKSNASVVDRTSEFSEEFFEYLATSPRHLSEENQPLINYNPFSEALRKRTSILLANHRISPLMLYGVIEKIMATKKTIRDSCRAMIGDNERDATGAAEAILLGRYIDSIMRLTALSQLKWATEVHVKRRVELIYYGWEMFLASGGFFKVMLTLKRDDVKPISDRFRKWSEEYLKDIEANYAKAVELYKMTDEEFFEKLRTRAGVTESQVAAADADAREEESETHKEKCQRCSLNNTPIFFSSYDNVETHDKFHEIDLKECSSCYEDFIEPELVMHRINTHYGLQILDDF